MKQQNKILLLSLSGALLAGQAARSADTLQVDHTWLMGQTEVALPYCSDSLNLSGKSFDPKKYLTHAKHWALTAAKAPQPLRALRAGTPLLPHLERENTLALSAVKFNVRSQGYAKAHIAVSGVADYKLYRGEQEVQGELTLSSEQADLTLLCLSRRALADTLSVTITSEQQGRLLVNAQGPRPYTMLDMMLGDHYRDVSLSPTGRYLVTHLYTTTSDGKNLWRTTLDDERTHRRLLERGEYVKLTWARERDVLYFTRESDKGIGLLRLNPETMAEEALHTGLPQKDFNIAPNEEFLIFSSTDEGPKPEGALKRLIDPDDRQRGWRSRESVMLFSLRTGLTRCLTFGSCSAWLSDISPDSRRLLLSLHRMDPSRHPFSRTTLVSVDVETLQADTLLCDAEWLEGGRFAPDARRLILKASPLAFDGVGLEVRDGQTPNSFDYRLYLYDPASRQAQPLLPGFKPAVRDYAWNTAEDRIYFTAENADSVSLFRLDPRRREAVRIQAPISCITDFAVSTTLRQPRAVIVGQSAEVARQMATARLGGEKVSWKATGDIRPERLYAGIARGTCHDWRFQAARGDSIDGFYFLPPHFDQGKTYPLIVYYYGGCSPSVKALECQYPWQVFAARGYVVYVLNPSGCTGYGQQFAARHVGTWGRESGDDIIEGTKKFLAAHPWADPARVGCIGASYGGFMTEYLLTRTRLFACAVAHAGISNIASYWGGGYWGYTYGECAQYGSYPWNNRQLYVEQSPLFNADKIHTPLLLTHGTADTNVPPGESQQLFTALRILGRPVSYLQVPGDNHVITDFKKRLEWQNSIFAWFDYWLRGEKEWWRALYPGDTAAN